MIKVHREKVQPTKQARRELKDIVFRETDTRWVHHPHVDALVITARVANSNVHCLKVDDGSTTNILYLNTYKKMGLIEDGLEPNNFPLYGLTRDHVIPKEVAKLTVIVGEHPRTSTVLANFLVVDALSAINEIIRRPLLKALKVATSVYHLTMKFPTTEGTGEVQGDKYDSREFYNKSLWIAVKNNKSPRMSRGKPGRVHQKGQM